MKELKAHLGGYGIVWNDMLHLQAAYKEAFQVLSASLIDGEQQVAVMSGCSTRVKSSVNGNTTIQYSAGFVYHDGEIIAFDGCDLTAPDADVWWWSISEENIAIPGSLKVKSTGGESNYFYINKKLQLNHGVAVPQGAIEHGDIIKPYVYCVRNSLFRQAPSLSVVHQSIQYGYPNGLRLFVRQYANFLSIKGSLGSVGATEIGDVIYENEDIVQTFADYTHNIDLPLIAYSSELIHCKLIKNTHLKIVLNQNLSYEYYGRFIQFNNFLEF